MLRVERNIIKIDRAALVEATLSLSILTAIF